MTWWMELQSNLVVDMSVGSVPLFKDDGLLTNPSTSNAWGLLINAGGGIVIMLWSFSIILILYMVLRYFGLHRVTPSDEEIGLDMALHNQKAYRRHCDSKREKSTGY
uniref:Ammonium transporter AmtB-like domain-containing protein n=1 Tax=Daphnia galeata TaxID=27404 RepID=A0A8J2RKT4_9CRUS|nr:unnamed protein product [Daphnia galeata]